MSVERYRTVDPLVKHLPVSHVFPVYPGAHAHLNAATRSVQLPPFQQGLLKHSLISDNKIKLVSSKE